MFVARFVRSLVLAVSAGGCMFATGRAGVESPVSVPGGPELVVVGDYVQMPPMIAVAARARVGADGGDFSLGVPLRGLLGPVYEHLWADVGLDLWPLALGSRRRRLAAGAGLDASAGLAWEFRASRPRAAQFVSARAWLGADAWWTGQPLRPHAGAGVAYTYAWASR